MKNLPRLSLWERAGVREAQRLDEGRCRVSGSDDGTVRIWELAGGHLLHTLRVPLGEGDFGKV